MELTEWENAKIKKDDSFAISRFISGSNTYDNTHRRNEDKIISGKISGCIGQ